MIVNNAKSFFVYMSRLRDYSIFSPIWQISVPVTLSDSNFLTFHRFRLPLCSRLLTKLCRWRSCIVNAC